MSVHVLGLDRAKSCPAELDCYRYDPDIIQKRFEEAVLKSDFITAEEMLRHGAQINLAEMPILATVASLKMDEAAKLQRINFLLLHGASVDGEDLNRRTALHNAARLGETHVFLRLLAEQPDLERRDLWGFTAIAEVAESRTLGKDAIDAWAAAYGQFDLPNNKQQTPLLLSSKRVDLEKSRAMFDHGAPFTLPDEEGRTALYYTLRASIPDPHPTLLSLPNEVRQGFSDLLLDMIYEMDDTEIDVGYGLTLLLCIAQLKRPNDEGLAISLIPHVRALIAKNASFDARDSQGNSALHIAALRGDEQLVRVLLEMEGVNFSVQNNDQQTPLQLAALRGHENIVRILQENGA